MKFSIIIPVYNVEKYLPICIESVTKQSYTDFEVILVDDGSTDSSAALCDKYAEARRNFHVVHQSNQGLSSARNNGVKNATGEYILFLDSDDYYSDNNCLKKIEAMANGCDIVAFNWASLDERKPQNIFLGKGPMTRLKQYYKSGEAYLSEALEAMPIYPWYIWIYAIRREYWLFNNFSFKEGVKYEDVDLTYRVLLNAHGFNVVKDFLYVYRENREGSTVTSLNYTSARDLLTNAKNNLLEIENNKEIIAELKKKLCSDFASNFYYVINRCNEIPCEDKKQVINLLKENKWMCNYTKEKGKHRIERILIKVLGVHISSCFLGTFRNIASDRC